MPASIPVLLRIAFHAFTCAIPLFLHATPARSEPHIFLAIEGPECACEPAPPCDEFEVNAAGLDLQWFGIYANDAVGVEALKFGVSFSDWGWFQVLQFCELGGVSLITELPRVSIDVVLDEPIARGTQKIACLQLQPFGVQTLDIVDHRATSVVVRYVDGELVEIPYEHRGRVSFGPLGGYLPCTDPVPTVTHSWGHVKARFR